MRLCQIICLPKPVVYISEKTVRRLVFSIVLELVKGGKVHSETSCVSSVTCALVSSVVLKVDDTRESFTTQHWKSQTRTAEENQT